MVVVIGAMLGHLGRLLLHRLLLVVVVAVVVVICRRIDGDRAALLDALRSLVLVEADTHRFADSHERQIATIFTYF